MLSPQFIATFTYCEDEIPSFGNLFNLFVGWDLIDFDIYGCLGMTGWFLNLT